MRKFDIGQTRCAPRTKLRIYAVAETQTRADAIAAFGIAERNGILRKIERFVSSSPIRMPLLERAKKIGRKFQNPVATKIGGPALAWKVLPLYLKNKEERFPSTPLGPFRTDVSIYPNSPTTGLRITWFGHSSMLIEIDGVRLLVDPVWDERASPVGWFGPKRFYAPPLPLDELPPLDAILISHDHYDHLGKQTVRQLAARDCRWITSLGVGKELRAFGVSAQRIAELDWTDTATVADLKITALPARHFSGRSAWNRFETLWSSFALRGSRHNIYYGADSGQWPGFADIGRANGPFDLTMLEIGAYNELWKAIHLGPDGAAEAFFALGAKGLLMPVHWGLFDLALHAWRQPMNRMVELADEMGIKLWTPHPGVPTDVYTNVEYRSCWHR